MAATSLHHLLGRIEHLLSDDEELTDSERVARIRAAVAEATA